MGAKEEEGSGLGLDEAVCSRSAPFEEADEALVVFHPESTIANDVWGCPVCGVRDDDEANVFIVPLVH